MAKYSVLFKGALAEFSAKYWMVKKRRGVAKGVVDLLELWKTVFYSPMNFACAFQGDIDHSCDVGLATRHFECMKANFVGLSRIEFFLIHMLVQSSGRRSLGYNFD